MAVTIQAPLTSALEPDRVLAAAYDFSGRRPEISPAVRTEHVGVHELTEDSADVTEGTPAAIGTGVTPPRQWLRYSTMGSDRPDWSG